MGIYPSGSMAPLSLYTCNPCGHPAVGGADGAGYCSRKCAREAAAGAANPRWRGAEASYFTLHRRVYRLRGKADHCERCGAEGSGTVYQWANLTGNYADVWDYEQMCVACHAAYDAPAKARGCAVHGAKLTEARVLDARRRYGAGEDCQPMAAKFGVSRAALLNAIKGVTWKHVPMGDFVYRPARSGPRRPERVG
jgi:hypothetical protein